MAHRRRTIDLDSTAIGIQATPDDLRIKLQDTYREAVALDRVEAVLNSDRGFCQITSFRSERGFARNDELFPYLPQGMRDATSNSGVGGFWLIAHWVELGMASDDHTGSVAVPDEPHHSLEYSWLLLQPRDLNSGDWFTAARLVAERYGQRAFIWRPNGETEAGVCGVDGTTWAALRGSATMSAAMKALTWQRAHKEESGQTHCQAFTSETTTSLSRGSGFAVHPALEQPTHRGPEAITLYAAKPHCISSQMFFAALQARSGG